MRWPALAVTAWAVAACTGDTAGPNEPPLGAAAATIVSDPQPGFPGLQVRSALAAGNLASTDDPEPVAWVSLPEATVPGGIGAEIENLASGQRVTLPVVSGGFDPVAIAAAAGDTLAVTVTRVDGSRMMARATVPARRRPRVVRTSPARGQRDVALNASIIVIFSEPIAPASLDTTRIRLTADGAALEGTVAPLAGSSVGVTFTPTDALAAGREYELTLDPGITDISGDAIEGDLRVPFSTASSAMPGGVRRVLRFAPLPTGFPAGLAERPAITVQALADGVVDAAYSGSIEIETFTTGQPPTRQVVSAHNGVATFMSPDGAPPGYWVRAHAAGFTSSVAAYVDVCGSACWWPRTAPQVHRFYPGSRVLSDGRLLVAGGFVLDANGALEQTATLQVYDPDLDAWTNLPSMGVPRFNPAIAEANGRYYFFGGDEGGSTAEYFEPASGTTGHVSGGWVPDLPAPAFNAAAVPIGDRIYLVGGLTVGGQTGAVHGFDAQGDAWSEHAPLPNVVATTFIGAFAVDGILHALGWNHLATYDPGSDAWTLHASASMPTLGGEPFPSFPNEDWCTTWDGTLFHTMVNRHPVAYDPATRTWTPGTQANRFCNGAFGVLNGELHFGGAGERPEDTRVFMAYRP